MIVGHLMGKLEDRVARVHEIEKFARVPERVEKINARDVHFLHWHLNAGVSSLCLCCLFTGFGGYGTAGAPLGHQ